MSFRMGGIALALVAWGASLPAQTATLSGTVTAAGSGSPLEGVIIRLEGTRHKVLTNTAGRYRMAGVLGGTYVVVAQRVGLAPERRTIALGALADVTADFTLTGAATVLAPTVVSATREERRRDEASATIDVLTAAELRRARPAHPNEALNRLPGVHLIELSGEGHMTAIRQPITTKPVYLYLEDGVPTRATGFFNHNALYEVNIPQAGGIEVLKGPGTALYGSDAIGGVISARTRPAPRAPMLEATAEGGAYGWGRALFSAGTAAGAHRVRADLNLTRTDGWRDASGYDRQSATVRWDVAGATEWSARTVVTGSRIDQRDVFTLTQAQFDARSPVNRSPITLRRVRALRVTSAIEKETGRTLWSATPYARYNVLDLMPYWQLSFNPQIWATRNASGGLLLKVRHDLAPGARIIAGVDADWSPGHFDATQVIATRTGPDSSYSSYTTGAKQYDYDVTYGAVSPYAHVELAPVPRLRVDLGLRYDVAGYAYDSKLAPLDTGSHRRPADTTVTYRHLSPKVGVTVDLARGLNLFAAYRHGFRAPSQQQLFVQGSADNTVGLKPVKSDSWEAGVRGELGLRAIYSVSAYEMTLTDDILTFVASASSRQAVNAGESRYRGLEASLGLALTAAVRLDASYALTSQRYLRYTPSTTADYSGNRVEQAPRDLASVQVGWSPASLRGGQIAVEYHHTGSYATDAANARRYGGHDLVGLQANWFARRGLELFARVTNLFDRRHAVLVAYDPFQGMQFTPGSPRTGYLGVQYTWER